MKNRGGPFVDNRLKERIRQYLTNSSSRYVDIGVLTADLQRIYSVDYGRRKRNAFRIQVEKVYRLICGEKEDKDLEGLEDEHLLKRARFGQGNDGEGETYAEDSSDSEDFPEYPQTNHMNNSLLSLYRKGNADSVSSTPAKKETVSTSTPVPVTSTAAKVPSRTAEASEGGWFVDRNPSGTREGSLLIDLCGEEDELRSGRQRLEKPVDYSLLEQSETKKKKKPRKEKRKSELSQDVDGEIESALLGKKAKGKAPELTHSTVKFEDVGGNEETLKEVCKMLIHMRHPEIYQQLGVVPPRGFLLHGPPGCGKTLLAQAIAGELELPMLKVAATEIVSGVSGESEQKLRELFEQAVTYAPCILFIDEIDAITPKREVASKDMERRIVAQLLTCMDDLNSLTAAAQVLVIGATNRPDSLDPALRRAGRFDREICLGIPDEAARERILRTLCRKLKLLEPFDFQQLAHLTPGYVGADLMALCREAAMCAVNRVLMEFQSKRPKEVTVGESAHSLEEGMEVEENMQKQQPAQDDLERLLVLLKELTPLPEEQLQKLCIHMEDFTVSISSVQPSAKREGFATVPDVTWADIGALEEIREELTMAILAPVQNPDQFKALGLIAPAGVLLAGPPGCGKTLLAKAVANESGLNFISVKGPELLNMYVGESERAVRQVFQRARNSAPCVIFFDELDALCPRRSDHESGASVRVVNQLLTEMDGLETRKQVFIMAATNRPDIIDPAILRPGRLDKTLYVGLPPPSDRVAILKTITKCGTRPPLEADVNLECIGNDERCDCFTGADLSALVREASISALRFSFQSSGNSKAPSGEIKVSQQHFEEAFKKVKSSVSKKDQMMYEQLRQSLCR
ncbi:nuclear valosin-containing protein-like isoform X1 [Latimeria chalumnae]|uniref:nuclear valosin-containing protein-like isoform X1 n=1 Tax=Latimeria chalumnae TaxID=7897 RepID=UPI0006D8FF6E|nr:PREDICTED: nuclear valosin-containing protein-like [Latimeria chalumnae]|eukprot:XP_014351867.1 PREDICTED: nuclear valosin-containing protein-like [Latimeria chalumnae]